MKNFIVFMSTFMFAGFIILLLMAMVSGAMFSTTEYPEGTEIAAISRTYKFIGLYVAPVILGLLIALGLAKYLRK